MRAEDHSVSVIHGDQPQEERKQVMKVIGWSDDNNQLVALFVGLPTVQFLITCSMQNLQAIKNWMVGRPAIQANQLVCYLDAFACL